MTDNLLESTRKYTLINNLYRFYELSVPPFCGRVVLVFIDNILVCSGGEMKHDRHLRIVLNTIEVQI